LEEMQVLSLNPHEDNSNLLERSVMTQSKNGLAAANVVAPCPVHVSEPTPDDPRVVAAVEEYLAALEAGDKPDRQAFLDRHADVAGVLAECLEGLQFVHAITPRLKQPDRE